MKTLTRPVNHSNFPNCNVTSDKSYVFQHYILNQNVNSMERRKKSSLIPKNFACRLTNHNNDDISRLIRKEFTPERKKSELHKQVLERLLKQILSEVAILEQKQAVFLHVNAPDHFAITAKHFLLN